MLKGLPEQKTSWHSTRLRSLRYIGSKIRIAPKIAEQLHATGAKTLVDVFGGSGAVIMNSQFDQRIYNDLDDDVVNFFEVLQCDKKRAQLLRKLENTPMSRSIFDELHEYYVKQGFSFVGMDSVKRAWALFYKSSYSFGGKIRNGGFGATVSDRQGCKEIKRYFGILRDFSKLGNFWKGTIIENLPFERLISVYKNRPGIVFYADPPYVGTEGYYSKNFADHEHFTLATALTQSPAAAVVSYYDCDTVRSLYLPEDGWRYVEITATKNSLGRSKENSTVTELLIIKEESR